MTKSNMNEKIKSAKRNHSFKIGEIVSAWNDLHAALFYIFFLLMGKERKFSARNMWIELGSDMAQRRMLKGYVDGLPDQVSELIDEVNWLLKETDKLTQYRNAFVHTSMTVFGDNNLSPNLATSRDSYVKNLINIGHKKAFIPLRNDIMALEKHTQKVRSILKSGKPWSSPKRPPLNALIKLHHDKKNKTRRKTHKRPLSPHQSSRQ